MVTFEGECLPLVVFQGVTLPPWAITLDHAALGRCIGNAAYGKLDGATDDSVQVFWWRFSICIGRQRSQDALIMIRHAEFLLAQLIASKQRCMPELSDMFDADQAPSLYQDWIIALEIIRSEAAKTAVCRWYAEPVQTVRP